MSAYFASSLLLQSGCQALYGWDIQAPGLLSANFYQANLPINECVALYLAPGLAQFQSTDKGSWSADPQTYHVGEALAPMLVEAFQQSFEGFYLLETEPAPEILARYGISYVVAIRIKDFGNQVTWKGQTLTLQLEGEVYDARLKFLARFESRGVSDVKKIFARKGGPEVNLNATIENAVTAMVRYLQDSFRQKSWESKVTV